MLRLMYRYCRVGVARNKLSKALTAPTQIDIKCAVGHDAAPKNLSFRVTSAKNQLVQFVSQFAIIGVQSEFIFLPSG